MKLIKPSTIILEQPLGLDGIKKMIEIAGRTCYKSEGNITEDSSEKFVQMLIDRGHRAMLEHGTVYLDIPDSVWVAVCGDYDDNKYSIVRHIVDDYQTNCLKHYITTNYRVLVENGWLEDLQYQCEPTEYHEKRVSARFICDRGVWNEVIRHKVIQKIDEDDFVSFGSIGEDGDKFSFAQESTRYCNYSSDKFGNELTFIIPCWMDLQEGIYKYDWDSIDNVIYWGWYNGVGNIHIKSDQGESTKGVNDLFLGILTGIEDTYFDLLEKGWQPQQARDVLPNSLKTEIVMTGFVSDWEHFFNLRCDKAAHPQMRELAIPLQEQFKLLKLI